MASIPLLLVFLLLCFSHGEACGVDRTALESFARSIDSGTIKGWNFNSSSSSKDCCEWVGITCESISEKQRVVGLDLSGKNLQGLVPESISHVEHLKRLDLSNNLFRGTVPSSLFHMLKLEFLDLSSNKFSGNLPSNLNLPSLVSVNFSSCSFDGPLPIFTTSSKLSNLDLSSNGFSTNLHSSLICNSSPTLQTVDISGNGFSGEVPTGFSECTLLKELKLGKNGFRGTLPEDLFDLNSLQVLSIEGNRFTGELSPRIGNLSGLSLLDVSTNSFSGSIPDVFDGMKQLESLVLSSNTFTGGLPKSFSSLHSIRRLSVKNNSLSGPVDMNYSSLPRLMSLDLGKNMFSGKIPESLSSCKELTSLNIARNKLEGEIPTSFSNLTALKSLSLSNNSLSNLSSALRTLEHCSSLAILVLTLNNFGEALPSTGIDGFKALELLVIANCHLVGSIPAWVSRCRELRLVDLSWNRLEGNIPSWFGELPNLFYLDLSNNSLTGEIPLSITGMKSLVLHPSNVTDPIGDLSMPEFPLFSRTNSSAKGLQYKQVASFPPSLILSINRLSGQIWPQFGNLKQLLVLDLHTNTLSGEIPDELSRMISLERLDLSWNNLTGSIPSSLSNLTFLSKFTVAFNRLHGKIPSGMQFSTFPNSSFAGNPGLCGEQLGRCGEAPGSPNLLPSPGSSGRGLGRAAGIAMAVGVAVGASTIILLVFFFTFRLRPKIAEDAERVAAISDNEEDAAAGSNMVTVFQEKDSGGITIENIRRCTGNFDQANIIGCGGFGLVYKATLPDGKKVAIKRLSGDFVEMEKEFRAEVEALSRARHRNLVPLQGYCRLENARLLIYSHMEHGSLDHWLHEKAEGRSVLTWPVRLHIARGASKGLAYLHNSCEPHILHRDIKSSNILLDKEFEAHVADFGLARHIQPYRTHVTTDLVGTLGYIPPEYGQSPVATYKGDIYSFGVVLLELLTGRRPMDLSGEMESRNLVPWAMELKEKGREEEIFDLHLARHKLQHMKQMLQAFEITCSCLRENPKERPDTRQVVELLDRIQDD